MRVVHTYKIHGNTIAIDRNPAIPLRSHSKYPPIQPCWISCTHSHSEICIWLCFCNSIWRYCVFYVPLSSFSIYPAMRLPIPAYILPSVERFSFRCSDVPMLSLLTIRCVHFISFADIKSNGCANFFSIRFAFQNLLTFVRVFISISSITKTFSNI